MIDVLVKQLAKLWPETTRTVENGCLGRDMGEFTGKRCGKPPVMRKYSMFLLGYGYFVHLLNCTLHAFVKLHTLNVYFLLQVN